MTTSRSEGGLENASEDGPEGTVDDGADDGGAADASPDKRDRGDGGAGRPRRRRWERDAGRRLMVNRLDGELLACLAGSRFLTTHQLRDVSGFSDKATRNHGRRLFDAGLAERVPLPAVLYHGSPYGGSAPEVYSLTARGAAWLAANGFAEEPPRIPDAKRKSLVFLPHELLVSDVRAWACRSARGRGQAVAAWREGPEAALPPVLPDAWFRVRAATVVEADRGTEREAVWRRKGGQYGALFSDPDGLERAVGSRTARVLVVCPSEARRDRIASWLDGSPAAARFWVGARAALDAPLTEPAWRRPGVPGLQAFAGGAE